MKETRSRSWSCIVYPDSAPEGWQQTLDDLHLEWVCSPLHNKDINPDGEPKKAHWHILLQFTNVKSYDQVNEICHSINATIPQRCHNTRGLIRYFCHLDNPEKAQYSQELIVCHGGADVEDLLKPSHALKQTYIEEMQEFCKKEKIVEFQDLYDYARIYRRSDWFIILNDSGCLPMKLYLYSALHRNSSSRVSLDGKFISAEELAEQERNEAEVRYLEKAFAVSELRSFLNSDDFKKKFKELHKDD